MDLERTLRIDAEFYQKENLHISDVLKLKNALSLTNFVKISDGNHMSISDKFIENGIPYYRGQDIHDYFIENANPICIDSDSFHIPYMKRSHLQKGDVLLSIVGTIGGLSLVYLDKEATCSCKLAILRPKKDVFPELIATFLSSKYGQNQIKKYTRGAVQMGLILEDMDQLLVPVFSEEFQMAIQNCIISAYNCLEASIKLNKEAENLLLEELALNDWESENTITIKTFEDYKACGRLDAEYYQPKYDKIESKIQSYKHWDIMGNHFQQQKKLCDFSNGYYNYIEIGDINVGNGSINYNKIETENLPANAKYQVENGCILISKVRPYRGAVAIINLDEKDLIASSAFTILCETGKLRKEVLVILMKTSIYKDWLLKWNVGSSYPVIKDEDVLNLPIPIFPDSIQESIALKVQESFVLKLKSERLLDLAKISVETAIEQREEQAIKLLNNHAQ